MGALGTITSEFKVLEKGIADAEKAVKSFGKEMQNALSGNFGNNPALHRIVTKTNFTGGVGKLFDQVKKNKVKAYSGDPMGEDVANELTGQLRHMAGLWRGNRKGGNANIQKMLASPMERIMEMLNTLGVSSESMLKDLSSVKPIKFSTTEMKDAEENIKKYIEGISRHLTGMESVFGSIEKKAGQEFKTAKHQKGASKKQSTTHKKSYVGGSDLRIDSEKYARSEKYRDLADQFISLSNRKAGNYGRMADAALINATLKGNKIFSGVGADYRGFWTEIKQGFKNGINDGMKNFDLGQLFSDTIKKGGKFRRQNKVLNKLGYDSDNLFETSAVLKSKTFKDFAKDKIKELGWQGQNVTYRDILNATTKHEKWQLRQQLRVKDEIDFSSMSKTDKAKIFAGLANNDKAKSMMGGMKMGGVFLTAAAGVAKLAEAAVNLGKECIVAFEGVEQLKTQLGVVFGSNIQSDKMFADIEAYAKKSPFGVENMTQQAVLLKQSGVYASDLMNTLKRLGDISSGNNEKMKSVSQVYARVMSSQTVTARDMRQLSTAGVPSYTALADSMGVDRGQIRSKLQAGQVSYTDFQKMIEKLTSEGGMFYGATEIGAKTLAARKQNLRDAHQMAKANVGEYLLRNFNPVQLISPVAALLGLGANKTGTVEDGWYSQVLGWLEKINGTIERSAEYANKRMDTEVPEKLKAEYEKQMAIANDSKKSALDRAVAADEAKKLADRWGAAVEKSISSGDWLYNQATTDDKKYLEQMEKAYGMHFSSMQEIWDQADFADFVLAKNSYTDEYGYLAFEKDLSTLLEEFKKKNPDTKAQAMTEEQLNAVKNGHFYQAEGFDKNNEAFNLVKYRIDHYFTEIVNATQRGCDEMDAQINNVKDTFDKFGNVNFGKQGLDGYGAQHLMRSALDDYHNNSPVWQMSWKDQKAYWDDQAKKEIDTYSAKTKTKDEKGNVKFDFSGLDIEEMVRAQEVLTSSSEKIQLLADPAHATDITGHLTGTAAEDKNAFLENLKELAKVAENSGGKDVFGPNFMNGMEELTKLLGKDDFGDHAVENVKEVVRLLNEDLIGNIKAKLVGLTWEDNPEQKAKLEAMLKAIEQSTNIKTHNDDTSGINARKQASLRAHVLSNVTGVSAERVANSKESSVMNAYLNNFSQRQTFAQLGKVLMQNGAELKDVARAMQEGKNGQKYGMYDWNKSTSSIEEQAAQKNVATQEALISAYQQQIDALQELTVGSIATRDQWDNLGSLSAQLGVAFELSAKTLADGTVQFTDATIQSAHKMMEELDFKKFNQQMTTIINKIEDQQHKEEGEAKIGSAVLEGKVSTSYVSSKNYGIIKQGLAQQVDVIKNEKDSTLKAGLNKSSFAGKEEAEEYVRTVNKKMRELGLDEIKVNVNTEKTTKGVATQSLVKEIDNLANKKLKDEYKATHPNDKNMGGFYNWAKEEQYYKGWGNKSRYEMAYKDAVVEKGLGGSKFNTGYSGGEFYLNRLQGKNVKDLPKQSGTGETKTTYSVQLNPKDVDKIVNSVKEDLTSGNVTDADVELVASLGGVRDKMGVLIDSIDKNTAAQDHENSLKEMEDIRGKMLDYLGSHGLLGGTEEERERNKALRNDKAFADMDTSNPLINKINTPHQDRLLELAGLSRNVDYDEFRKRRVNKIVNFGTDDKGKEKYLGLKDDAAVEEMRHYLTDTSSSKYVKKLKKVWNKDTGNEGVEKLKGQLKESGFDPFAKDALGEMDTSQLQTMLELFDQMGISVRELAAGGQEWDETLMDASLQLEELSQGIKNTAMDGLVKGLNTGFSKAGDLAYKLQNNLIEGADATMEMKKALAGVGAEMLNNIGAAMTETGLKIAGGAAAQAGGPNWSLVAAGLALAAAGGAASFGGGMLSAFASDNNKGNSDEAEDQLARLEDLKDNLAELLKQAKDDAIYYETNLRQKQAVAFNDAVSSTNVNDAIITPSGVVNTAPDDYIMAMKDPTQLMGKGGGGTNVNFSIVNESGTPMTVTRSETREGSGGTEIVAFVNAIVQKSMNDGEYDDVMAGMQVRQKGSQISS